MTDLESLPLPGGIQSRFIEGVNGLRVHVLEAGDASGPLILLLHGFPELAYSWRKVIPALAEGAWVVAPDVRGYGRTSGWTEGDLGSFSLLNLLRDTLALVARLGRGHVDMLVGHDAGSAIAAMCALARPDVFRRVVLMSAPFGGAPAMGAAAPSLQFLDDLARLEPARKHYHWYYSSPAANTDMWRAPQGLHAFMRAYYHHKSADWAGNRPHRLAAWSAAELAKLPTYYVMRAEETMAETVAHEMPGAAEIAACAWLPEAELAVYSGEYARTGFGGALSWYRGRTSGLHFSDFATFAGRAIEVPAAYVAGRQDWGTYQKPGDFEAMQGTACPQMRMVELIEGAGHWVQQERPAEVAGALMRFFRG